jgi:hypothetical protein
MLSGVALYFGLITRPEESYQELCVCGRKTSIMNLWIARELSRQEKNKYVLWEGSMILEELLRN